MNNDANHGLMKSLTHAVGALAGVLHADRQGGGEGKSWAAMEGDETAQEDSSCGGGKR
jgi:hypothetical protein